MGYPRSSSGGVIKQCSKRNPMILILCSNPYHASQQGVLTRCYVVYFSPNSALSIGSVLGDFLAERASWMWVFWFLSIFPGLCLLLIIVFLPKTAGRIVKNGSILPCGINKALFPHSRDPSEHALIPLETSRPMSTIINPLACLLIVCHKDTALVLFANAIFYMNYNCMQASLFLLLMSIYKLNALPVGLAYLLYIIACGIASYVGGKHFALHDIIHISSGQWICTVASLLNHL